jgi:hypothetical protein
MQAALFSFNIFEILHKNSTFTRTHSFSHYLVNQQDVLLSAGGRDQLAVGVDTNSKARASLPHVHFTVLPWDFVAVRSLLTCSY